MRWAVHVTQAVPHCHSSLQLQLLPGAACRQVLRWHSGVSQMHQARQLDRSCETCRTFSRRQASCSVWAPWMRMTQMLLATRMKMKTKNPQKMQMQTSLPMPSARQELLELS